MGMFNTVQGFRAGVKFMDSIAVVSEVKFYHIGQFFFIVYH